jgi:hypothetical protein
MKTRTSLGALVHQRLKNASEKSGRTFNDLAQYYALERWLYRLSKSRYAQNFILKGALMLVAWRAPVLRATRDIDLLARMSNNLGEVKEAVAEVCRTEVEEDGVVFDADTIVTERIAEDAEYEGVRANFRGLLASSIPYPRQIDPRKAKLAMKIGRHYRIREVTHRDWDRCARELRLRPGELHERMDVMMARLPDAALSVAAEMNKEGLTHPVVTSLAERLPLWIKKQQQQLAKKHGQHRGLRLRHLSPSGSWGQRARTLRLQTG